MLFNKFSIKNNIIHNVAVADNIFCRRIFIFTSFFVLNKVSMLARLEPEVMTLVKECNNWGEPGRAPLLCG